MTVPVVNRRSATSRFATEWLRPLLAIDTRSLAAFRIALGILLLLDLCVRGTDILSHYTDVGVLPRPARITLYEFRGETSARFWWSLHMINGTGWFQLGLFSLAACVATCLTLGYRTRMATFMSWALLVSLHSRLPGVNQGGDILLRMLLFWSMFLPLGATASVDRFRWPADRDQPSQTIASLGSFAMLVQVLLVYWCTAYAKLEPTWTRDFSAIYYALEFDMYVRPVGIVLREYPVICRVLTGMTLCLEFFGPLLLLIPVRTWIFRLVAVALFWSFHLGLALCLELGLFSYVSMTAWLLFLPGQFWDGLSALLRRARDSSALLQSVRLQGALGLLNLLRRPAAPVFKLSWPGNVFVACCLAIVLQINFASLHNLEDRQRTIDGPGWMHAVTAILRIEQRWLMFAPRPARADGWCLMRGVLMDGTEVNLWQPEQPLPFTKPTSVRRQFPNHRWRKYVVHLCWDADGEQLSCFSDWLSWRWNLFYSNGQPERQVRMVEIVFYHEETPPPGEPAKPVQAFLLWNWDYLEGRTLMPDGEPGEMPEGRPEER